MTDIDALLAAMTLAEKAGQLNMLAWGAPLTGAAAAGDATDAVRAGQVGSLLNLVGAEGVARIQRVAVEETRLRIPLFFGNDVIHGHRTVFPIPLAEAGLFDPATWEETARVAAIEAAADGQDLTFAPMLDVARDPRWGRSMEGPGEDAWVASRFATAKTRGFQGSGLEATDALAACAKHFCGYGAVTAGREYAATDVSGRTVREVYLPPFEAAVAAGVATIMPALSDLDGVPMTANVALLRGWLRERQGFDGVIISDYGAIRELINHGIAGDEAQAAAAAIRAGCDIDMMGYAYVDHLAGAVARGLVSEAEVDACVRRVLVFKQRLGLFDDPYRRCKAGAADAARTAGHRRLSRAVAAKALVLLTNGRGLVPVAPGRQRIAVIGPLADAPREMAGPWAVTADRDRGVSVLAGLREVFAEATLDHAAGVAIEGGDASGIVRAVEAAGRADLVVLCLGEGMTLSGEATSRTDLDLPGRQRALAEAVLDAGKAAGKPVIAVLFCGRPPIVPWLAERADALLCAWFLGDQAGGAIADVLAGRVAPSGRLAMTWPRSMGQVPIFYGEKPGGRPRNPDDHFTSRYLDSPNTPLFPFGHGLATTDFTLADLRTDADALTPDAPLRVDVTLANAGAREGEATAFLFIRDPVAGVTRPVLELRGVAKATLAPGRRETLRLTLTIADAAFPGEGYEPIVEAGDLDILVGFSAAPEGLLRTRVRVEPGAGPLNLDGSLA